MPPVYSRNSGRQPGSPAYSVLDRETIPELLHPEEDPGLRRSGEILERGAAIYDLGYSATVPGVRPVVFQSAVNFSITVTTQPKPLMNGSFPADGVIFSIPAGGTECFYGYGASVTISSGALIPAGTPIALSPDNTRELWEIQRAVEAMASIMAKASGVEELPPYKAPRVALDLSKYWIVSSGTQNVSVMAFNIPEGQ